MAKGKVLVATFNVKKLKVEQRLEENNYPKSIVVRLGGIGSYDHDIQINSAKSVMNCIDKLKTKALLKANNVPTLDYYMDKNGLQYPFVMKGNVRSRGTAVYLVENDHEFAAYAKLLKGRYYLEPLFPFTSEYRLHCTKDKVFFAVKKIKEVKEDVFINAENHKNVRDFMKPRRWAEIQAASVAAIKALGLDIGAVDVGYNSNTEPHQFIIHEVNTSPELQKNTFDAYIGAIDELVKEKL